MKFDKGLIAGSSTLLVLTLLESGDSGCWRRETGTAIR